MNVMRGSLRVRALMGLAVSAAVCLGLWLVGSMLSVSIPASETPYLADEIVWKVNRD